MLVSRPLQAAFVRACAFAAEALLCPSRAQSDSGGECLLRAWLSDTSPSHHSKELYGDAFRLLVLSCHKETADRPLPAAALASAYQHAMDLASTTLVSNHNQSPSLFSLSCEPGVVYLADRIHFWISHIAQQRRQRRHRQSLSQLADALLDQGEYQRQGFQMSVDAPIQALSLVRRLEEVGQDLGQARVQDWTHVLSSFLSSCTCLYSVPARSLSALTPVFVVSPQHLSLLLGFRCTPGSTDTPLPFSLSSCFFAASQLAQYDPDAFDAYWTYVHSEPHVQKSTYPKPKPPSLLTAAGKAFSKHAHRDTSTSFWGSASGSRACSLSLSLCRPCGC